MRKQRFRAFNHPAHDQIAMLFQFYLPFAQSSVIIAVSRLLIALASLVAEHGL